MLDAQIYAVRCFLGETVQFTQVRKGKDAPAEEPCVLYQKMRFLDEEMGKHLSLYGFEGTGAEMGSFVTALAARDDLMELFAPSEKCVTAVRVPRTGTVKAASDEVDGMLKDYENLHGGQVGVIIKNGENLYIGWTDEEKVKISDGNLFYDASAKTEERQISEDEEKEEDRPFFTSLRSEEELEKERTKQKRDAYREGAVSRWFLLSAERFSIK